MKTTQIKTNQQEPRAAAQRAGKHMAATNFTDQRASTGSQLVLTQMMQHAPHAVAQRKLMALIHNSPRQIVQRQENNTGMPDQLKNGIETLSGMEMSDVRVHRNSARPAQLNALAYAQGSEIHLAPGQEQHLPHEAWHVAQQKQGRVKPTLQLAEAQINDDAGLEQEADLMGARALQLKSDQQPDLTQSVAPAAVNQMQGIVIQRTIQSAAEELFQGGIITVKNNMFKPKFNKAHGVTKSDLTKIQEALNALREESGGGTDKAEKMLSDAKGDMSDVKLEREGIEVYLDIDQLKHQPTQYPIGSRQTKGGNTFKPPAYGSKDWHRSNTLVHMADWAESLGDMEEGQREFHGQATPVGGIHYEGYCLFAKGKKYVLFHCYPADKSPLKM